MQEENLSPPSTNLCYAKKVNFSSIRSRALVAFATNMLQLLGMHIRELV